MFTELQTINFLSVDLQLDCSGKSFGIVEVAKSIASSSIKKLDFNLSQFNSPLDLANAFHKVRDVVLEGKILSTSIFETIKLW